MNARGMGALVVAALLLLNACSDAATSGSAPADPASASQAAGRSDDASSLSADDPYVRLATDLQRHGVRIWFETDLVARWQQGPREFATAVDRAAALARLPGVQGLKIADELGYGDGLRSEDEARQFLGDAAKAVHRRAPRTRLLVDMVVPELGCLPWRGGDNAQCAATARSEHPAATEQALTNYLESGDIDVLDLSTGLLDADAYRAWGTDPHGAQGEIWAHVAQSRWSSLTRLQGRKALAGPGGYGGSEIDAATDVATYVDTPVAGGAVAVDIWTWRQSYDGQTVSLLAPDLRQNPLWAALRARHDRGIRLLTHMTPSNMPTESSSFDQECATVAQVFDEVFVAAGTG